MCEICYDICATCRKALHKCHPINYMPPDRWWAPLWLAERQLLLAFHWLRTVSLLGRGMSEERRHLYQKFLRVLSNYKVSFNTTLCNF